MTRKTQKAEDDRHFGFRWLSREAGLARREDAEVVFRTVARLLAERIGREETRHLASHLPLGLREVWEAETHDVEEPRRFDRGEFLASVQSQLDLDGLDDAAWLTETVFAWVKHLAPEERSDVAARLPGDLKETWEEAELLHLESPRRIVIGQRLRA